ncbi:MAG: lysine--tRNA ligase [Phycisphaerales bacterium]|nr:lysine--tRNA ligase [Phycisphaerales bacterium]
MSSVPADSSTDSPPPTPSIHPLEQQRRDNRDAAAKLGGHPYGQRVDGLVTLAEARRRYDEAADAAHQAAGKTPVAGYVDQRPVVTVAGRIVLRRDGGKLIWMNLRDHTGDLQVAISARDCDDGAFNLAKLVELGDLLIATGPLMKTKTGEVTVWASSVRMGGKCLVQPPEKHAGLQDIEQRYRRRYVDMWATPETLRVFQMRSRIVSRIRRHLDEREFLEVETPVLQQLAGGAAARPFVTHMNALDLNLFMRIAPELYLKRLMVGGMPRVYEVSRNFRNEGVDKSHNPEFTSIEIYQAYGDVRTMMDLAEGLVRELAQMVVMESQDLAATVGEVPAAEQDAIAEGPRLYLPFGDLSVDYGSPFVRITYGELFKRALGFPMSDVKRARQEAVTRGLLDERKGALADVLVINELFEEVAEKLIDPARPTFVIDYPAAISPLTRPHPDRPEVADRADLFIGGMEVGPFYTELNDPDVQEAKFREQLVGVDDEESTFRTFDQDFIDALKVGMPPAGGLGLGIDRLVMLLTNQRTIRDVILFPMMRPVGDTGTGVGGGGDGAAS